MRVRVMLGAAAVCIAALAFTIGAAAGGSGWITLGNAAETDDYYASADARGEIQNPKALAIQVSAEKASWSLSCQGEIAPARGRINVAVGSATKCSLSAYATTSNRKPARASVKLLAKRRGR